MILIFVNILDMNKKELYEKTSKQQKQPSSVTKKSIFENFEGSRSNLSDY